MLFPTFSFAIFFAVVFPLSWILRRWDTSWKLFLLGASYYFYGSWDPRFLILIFSISVVSYFVTVGMASTRSYGAKKILLWIGVGSSLSVLGFFKYFNFFTESFRDLLFAFGYDASVITLEIVLPVGISFFTFQALSYVVDVYRKEIQVDLGWGGLLNFLLYIAFFPQLVAGPIVRARTFLPQLKASYTHTVPEFSRAFSLILGGLFKKMILSTYIQMHLVDNVFNAPANYSAFEVLCAIYGFSVQIYCDFSGYSDIAIGIALLLGFQFPQNFNHPYRATSIQDFWRRWHITLSTWLRDYLYISLGGNRGNRFRTGINLFLTMFLGGLWHGASISFLIWGSFHGIGLMAHRAWGKFKTERGLVINVRDHPLVGLSLKMISIFVTFHFVSFLWVFFYHKNFMDAIEVFQALFRFEKSMEGIELYTLLVIVLGLGIHFFGKFLERVFLTIQEKSPFALQVLCNSVLFIILIKMSPDIIPPFIYFQF